MNWLQISLRHPLITIFLTIFPAAAALAQSSQLEAFPTRTITWVVPFPPGGAVDIVSRIVAERVAKNTGQPVVVENRGGSGGLIGTASAVRADPDGYTIVINSTALAVDRWFYASVPYDAQKHLKPIVLLATVPSVVVVNADVPAKSLQELILMVQASPKKYTFASAGRGTSIHLASALLAAQSKMELLHVPYRGSGPAVSDLISGRITMMTDSLTAQMELIKSGSVRPLAVTSSERSSMLPQVPTVAESGVPQFEVISWFGVFAPSMTPPVILERLNVEMNRALADPAVQERLSKLGIKGEGGSPERLADLLSSETRRWAAAITEYKLDRE